MFCGREAETSMAIFRRVREIISASLNELLVESEDPERSVQQIIREMERAIAEVRHQTADSVAELKMTERRIEKAQTEQESCVEQAKTALRHRSEDQARRALRKKRKLADLLEVLEKDLEEKCELVRFQKEELALLEEKVQEARLKRETLVAKKRLAETKRSFIDQVEGGSGISGRSAARTILDGQEALERLADEADVDQAEADAQEEVLRETRPYRDADHGRRARRDQEVEDELDSLKEEMET